MCVFVIRNVPAIGTGDICNRSAVHYCKIQIAMTIGNKSVVNDSNKKKTTTIVYKSIYIYMIITYIDIGCGI